MADNYDMRLSKEYSGELLASVRKELVIDPNITIAGLQERLEALYDRRFDKNYVAKLKNKAYRERGARISNSLAYEVSAFEDTVNEACARLWEIIDDESATARDKIAAMRGIMGARSDLIDIKTAAGAYNQQPKKEVGVEWTEEQKAEVERALNFALNPDRPTKQELV